MHRHTRTRNTRKSALLGLYVRTSHSCSVPRATTTVAGLRGRRKTPIARYVRRERVAPPSRGYGEFHRPNKRTSPSTHPPSRGSLQCGLPSSNDRQLRATRHTRNCAPALELSVRRLTQCQNPRKQGEDLHTQAVGQGGMKSHLVTDHSQLRPPGRKARARLVDGCGRMAWNRSVKLQSLAEQWGWTDRLRIRSRK